MSSLRKRVAQLESAAAESADDRAGWCSLWPIAVHPGEPTPVELAAFERLFVDGSADPLPVEEELMALAAGIGLGDTPPDCGRADPEPDTHPGDRHDPS